MKIDKNIALQSSYYIGYLILDSLKNRHTQTIYDLYYYINKKNKLTSRQLMMGMIFLFSLGLIEFSEAKIWLIK